MSMNYREGNNNYEQLDKLSNCIYCSGSCSCGLGSRSVFDQLQYQSMVLGQNNYAFDQTRKLDIGYNYPTRRPTNYPTMAPSNQMQSNEKYSGMVDPYNEDTYLLWPPSSCN